MGSSHDIRATMPSTATIRPIKEESKENKLGEWAYVDTGIFQWGRVVQKAL